jgi:hypothetical protein
MVSFGVDYVKFNSNMSVIIVVISNFSTYGISFIDTVGKAFNVIKPG